MQKNTKVLARETPYYAKSVCRSRFREEQDRPNCSFHRFACKSPVDDASLRVFAPLEASFFALFCVYLCCLVCVYYVLLCLLFCSLRCLWWLFVCLLFVCCLFVVFARCLLLQQRPPGLRVDHALALGAHGEASTCFGVLGCRLWVAYAKPFRT